MPTLRAKETGRQGIMRAVIDLLTVEKIWHVRMNVGAFHNGKRPVFFGRKGMADIQAIPRITTNFPWGGMAMLNLRHERMALACPTWIECKRPGERMTPDQEAFRAEVEAEGHFYLLVEDAAELQAWLRQRR
jgi:hypothetical protein